MTQHDTNCSLYFPHDSGANNPEAAASITNLQIRQFVASLEKGGSSASRDAYIFQKVHGTHLAEDFRSLRSMFNMVLMAAHPALSK